MRSEKNVIQSVKNALASKRLLIESTIHEQNVTVWREKIEQIKKSGYFIYHIPPDDFMYLD